jgi:hypothetical protein
MRHRPKQKVRPIRSSLLPKPKRDRILVEFGNKVYILSQTRTGYQPHNVTDNVWLSIVVKDKACFIKHISTFG